MKRFFKNKEPGAITPLPPSSQSPTPSSFEVPREFDQYHRHQQHRLSSPIHSQYAEESQPRRRSQQLNHQSDVSNPYSALPPSLRPGQVIPRHDLHHNIESAHSRSRLAAAPYMQHSTSDQSIEDTSSRSGYDQSSDEQDYSSRSYAERRSSIPHSGGTRRRMSRREDRVYRDTSRDETYSDQQPGAVNLGSTAYPVYSGEGEVMVTQGHFDDVTHLEGRDKDKAKKKLFGFSSSTREKKTKSERDLIHDTSGANWNTDGLLSSQSEPQHSRERSKEGWMDKWNKRAQQQQDHRLQDKELEGLAASKVGWLAAHANSEDEWMEILPLIDMVSHSEAASKEAVRALRKEFKYGSVDTQRRAVRIWALLTLNSSDRFRFQVATKRFLDSIEDTISSSKTPLSVKDTMLRVLGVLAFEFKDDSELNLITKCWNKTKPSDRPKNGEPLENDLFEFRLPQPSRLTAAQHHQQKQEQNRPSQQAHFQQNQQYPKPPTDFIQANTTNYLPRNSDPHHPQKVPQMIHQQHQHPQYQVSLPHQQQHRHAASDAPVMASDRKRDVYDPSAQQQSWTKPIGHEQVPLASDNVLQEYDVVQNFEAMVAPGLEDAFIPKSDADPTATTIGFEDDVRRLYEDCQTSKSHANVLIDTMIHADPESSSAELVEEFYGKVLKSQELVVSQIPWASAQADQSRDRLDQRRTIAASEHIPVSQNEETDEERLLAELLETHSRLIEASSLVDEMHRRIAEEEEERRVTERSKVEVRLDRSALAQDSTTGILYDIGRGRPAHNHLLDPYSSQQQASGSRSTSPHGAHSQTGTEHAFSPPSLGLISPSANGQSPSVPQGTRISRPLPVPRSDPASDSNSVASSIVLPGSKHQQVSSLQAVAHSTHSNSRLSLNQSVGSAGSDSRTHSRDTSQSSQLALSATQGYRAALSPGSDVTPGSSDNLVSPSNTRSLPLTPSALNISTTSAAAAMRDHSEEEDVQTPIHPSEKALGKRRAVSVRYSSPPVAEPALQTTQAFARLQLDAQ